MSIKSLCSTHTLTVYALAESRDAAGGMKKSSRWSSTGTEINCRIQPASSRDIETAAQNGYVISHTLYSANNPGVKHDYKLTYGSRTFLVRGTATDTDEFGRLWKFFAEEIESAEYA